MIPRSTLGYVLDRLRLNYVPDTLYSDEEVLVFLNDAYLEACEHARCLVDVHAITTTPGVSTYPLPSDFGELIYVCANGAQLRPLAYSDALTMSEAGYYLLAGRIGLVLPQRGETGAAMILYAAKPLPLATYESSFDARFPIEFSDVLVYYVRWRVNMLSGGAERIRMAQIDRTLFDNRVKDLRRTTNVVTSIGPPRLAHAQRRRRRWWADAC